MNWSGLNVKCCLGREEFNARPYRPRRYNFCSFFLFQYRRGIVVNCTAKWKAISITCWRTR